MAQVDTAPSHRAQSVLVIQNGERGALGSFDSWRRPEADTFDSPH